MRFNFGGLGAPPTISFNPYQPIVAPPAVTKFMAGSYSNGVYSEALPDQRLVQDYEDQNAAMIAAVVAKFHEYKAGDPVFTDALKVDEDIRKYSEYFIQKTQVQNPTRGTPYASGLFYNKFFGGFSEYELFNKWLNQNISATTQGILDSAQMQVSAMYTKENQAKTDFFVKVIVPLAGRFSQDDQLFLKDNFINTMNGGISLDDLLKVYLMIAPYITMAQYAQVFNFSYEFVLGNDLAANMLNPSNVPSYGLRNINAEVAEIQANYSAIKSRLGHWLDPATDALVAQHIDNYRKAYADPNNPAYSVSPVGQAVNTNIMLAVTNALSSVQPHVGGGGAPATTLTADDVKGSMSDSASSGLIPVLLLGGLAWYLTKRRK